MTDTINNKDEPRTSISELMATSAIETHVRWKVRLEAYIDGTGREKLDPAIVGKDDECTLGVWIHGHGATHFGHTEQFAELKKVHAEFHRCAADIIREADKGNKRNATRMLSEGDYAKYSSLVKTLLTRVWMELDNK